MCIFAIYLLIILLNVLFSFFTCYICTPPHKIQWVTNQRMLPNKIPISEKLSSLYHIAIEEDSSPEILKIFFEIDVYASTSLRTFLLTTIIAL